MEGLEVKELGLHKDQRGWLAEILRDDQNPFRPVMSYLSMTNLGYSRGPHEHKEQTDCFCFVGRFRIYLWDNRDNSSTYGEHKIIDTSDIPTMAIVPPGIVHAYRNIGSVQGLVINLPDKLYGGWGKTEDIDEIRYEDDPESPFRIGD
ncbi:MAG: dTDP-4-dehydrorhamnose 3,5-epimerase [Nitrospiraceae bacterium]|nr:MAG: dTDP-4-dehydrorhamnose 3,5-epimerase [Nitrospiraceae bacterium]